MENPTFHLENVVRVRGDLEDFEGPLTLILQLLSKNKIEIQDIQISQLLEQYLAYLDEMKAMDLEIASEFVAMASYLVYIKTKVLLSAGEEEVSELEQLISTLETMKSKDAYKQIQAVTAELQAMFRRGGATYVKPPEPLPAENGYRYSHQAGDLAEAMRRVLTGSAEGKIVPRGRPFSIPKRIVYSVGAKSREILDLLRKTGIMKLSALYFSASSRSELVATFLSVLEMCRDGQVLLSGDEEDLMISDTGLVLSEEGAGSEYDEQEENGHGDS